MVRFIDRRSHSIRLSEGVGVTEIPWVLVRIYGSKQVTVTKRKK